jgi:formylglycine-generating enzyme
MKLGSQIAFLMVASIALRAAPPPVMQGPNEHRMRSIPSGDYALGNSASKRNPYHRVNLAAFRIADAETTNAQFAAFVKATNYVTDAERTGYGKVAVEGMDDWAWDQVDGACWRSPMGSRGPTWEKLRDHPVTQISGADAMAYCRWIGARLPTLDEWETAARAGVRTKFPWGDAFDPKQANIWNGKTHRRDTQLDGFLYTAPVRSFPPNAWGLHDVIGNVFEYCSDLPQSVEAASAAHLVAGRGGSWWCSVGTCSFFNLIDIGTMARHGTLSNQGFRIAMGAAK